MSGNIERIRSRREFIIETTSALAKGGGLLAGAAAIGCSESTPPDGIPVVRLAELAQGDTPFTTLRILVRRDGNSVHAINLTCTHQTCLVAPAANGFRCPCHGSEFAADGKVLRGPALWPLRHVKLALNANGMIAAFPAEQVPAEWRLTVG